MPYLSAFGSSRIKSDDPIFADVQQLSEKLAKQGWHGITGGHQGMMAAFSQGIRTGGGEVYGITLERFPTPPDNTFSEEIRANDFFSRMQQLIEKADAYLVLPGGLGTLAELAMTWDLLAIHALQQRPLIVYGEMWQTVLNMLQDSLVMSVDNGFDCLISCHTHNEVLEALQHCHHS